MKRQSLMLVVMAVLASAAGGGVRAAPEVEVASALTRLAARHDFTVSGIEQARGRLGRLREGALERRLRHLLAGIDHVILRTADGRVQRVILPGGREPVTLAPPSPPAVLALRRKGAALVVVLTLESADGRPRPQPLLVDSGAGRTLLPASLCAELGLDLEGVAPVAIALGGAEVQALPGRLAAVRAGPRRVVEVEVGCVEGRALGGNALLGEDLLGRLGARLDRDGARLLLDPAPGD
ncbi:retroviral-like aspartic protease family protein [Marichromatium purpuratum]|nr:retroviral-like aspartic protease family protein [Marichromatium purpuratum]